MSSGVAALPFQSHANYVTWSIEIDIRVSISITIKNIDLLTQLRLGYQLQLQRKTEAYCPN